MGCNKNMKILIPAAGRGQRFQNSKYTLPKPCIKVDGEYMLLKSAKSLGFRGQFIFIIRENEYRKDLAEKLQQEYPNCKIAVIDFDTDGAAETCLIAEEFIDIEEELVIANCDQILDWDHYNSDVALKQLRKFDAGVICVESTDEKHSYARVENNLVVEIEEKKVISNFALTGIHYWKHGSDFVSSAKEMISKNIRSANNEFYVGPTYNQLIANNKKVGVHTIPNEAIHFVGTPSDLEQYESQKTE